MNEESTDFTKWLLIRHMEDSIDGANELGMPELAQLLESLRDMAAIKFDQDGDLWRTANETI